MGAPWHTGKFIEIKNVTPTTRLFKLQVNDVPAFDFVAGQFVTFDLPIGEKPKERWRSYSIASNPNGSNIIEFVIVYVDGGSGTEYLFNKAKEGTELRLMGPLGKFTLPENIENDLCFICTGTGVAPFRSMIKDLILHKKPFKNIYLIFGTRTIKDILYYEELNELAQEVPNLHYIVTLSREASKDWKGGKGYVHAIYEEIFSDGRPADFYLCGWRNMIDEARKRLANMGYDSKNIHLEIYG